MWCHNHWLKVELPAAGDLENCTNNLSTVSPHCKTLVNFKPLSHSAAAIQCFHLEQGGMWLSDVTAGFNVVNSATWSTFLAYVQQILNRDSFTNCVTS